MKCPTNLIGIDISPLVLPGQQIIQSYGLDGFKIAGNTSKGSVLILPNEVIPWPVKSSGDITIDLLRPVTLLKDSLDILVLGCGENFLPPSFEISNDLREFGIVMEWMATGAACRTFNVLLSESRNVAAALISIP